MMRKARKRVRLISGEDAIGAITNYAKFLRDNFHEPCNLTGMIDAIEALPTIDPVKHGRWETEVRAIQGYKIPFFACSNCGKNAVEEYRYCPNCGARMMEGRADDER